MADFVKLDDNDKGEKEEKKEKSGPKKYFTLKIVLLGLLIFFILSSILSSVMFAMSPKIAVVPISGVITTDKQSSIFGSSTSSREIATTLLELAEDNSVKAVILDINSPGGSPVASEEISRAIEKLSEKKKVYALINDVGASGAFWIAVSADKVYASSMSIIGSIGVTSAGLSFEDFIKEYNITYRKQTAGELKDMGSIFREPTEVEEMKIQQLLDEIHENFIIHIANARNISIEEVREVATGEIFLGSKGKNLNLIDEIGYYPDVISDIKKEVGESVLIVNYGPSPSFFDILGVSSLFSFDSSDKSKIMLK